VRRETVRLLIDTLLRLTQQTSEHWLQIKAMERTLESYPAAKEQYERWLETLRRDPGAELNRLSRLERLEALRTELFLDREE
jgi:hypothetical protein